MLVAAILAVLPNVPVDPPALEGAMAPRLTASAHGPLLTWMEPAAAGDDATGGPATWRLRWSRLRDETWTEPATIVEGREFFVNWADVPAIAEAADGTLFAHWLEKSGPDTYAYDVVMARSTDAGASWNVIGRPHRDGTPTEHGFVSMVPEAAGVRVFWLDGREMTPGGHGHGGGDMTLRTTLVGAGGDFAPGERLDARVCECCNTSAAVTAAGPLIVYRDRSTAEHRDVAVVRRAEGAWTPPRPVHADGWAIAACPVNGPAIDASGANVVVAWYTGATDEGTVRAAFSSDGGASFGPAIDVDTTMPAGRVAVVLEAPDRAARAPRAAVSWLDADGLGGAIRLATVHADGRVEEPVKVSAAALDRASGFPVMVRHGGKLLVVWTEVERGEAVGLRGALVARPGP